MIEILKAPIQLQELTQALQDMASNKAPGYDGVITEFYKALWPVIGKEFFAMLQESLSIGRLPKGMNNGIISLLPKEGNRNSLNHWRPITLLNVPYKIWAKTLQLRLQPILMEIICPDQTAFLPLRFILDTIFLTHETLAVAKRTNQPFFFLKMDFSKAYDRVDLRLLFAALEKFGFPPKFMAMIQLLFFQVEACVSINGRTTDKFRIGQGVRQGCLLAPYLFLIVGEVLNLNIKQEVAAGRFKGIRLPGACEDQIIGQYAYDTNLTLRTEENTVTSSGQFSREVQQCFGLIHQLEEIAGLFLEARAPTKTRMDQSTGLAVD
jgi:hypothetical protein